MDVGYWGWLEWMEERKEESKSWIMERIHAEEPHHCFREGVVSASIYARGLWVLGGVGWDG